jgi:hypothetical protein
LALGTEGYSAALVAKIEYAGANEGSFHEAAEALKRLAELPISAKHVQRITERLGQERAEQRDRDVERMKAGKLAPSHAQTPRVAAIHPDAGKIQLRADDGQAGVRQPHWSDTKVGCLLTYSAPAGNGDPQPQPPKAFLDPPQVMRLCQEIQQVRSDPSTRATAAKTHAKPAVEAVVEKPRRLVRTAVATMQGAEAFGWMVATEAARRGFYQARPDDPSRIVALSLAYVQKNAERMNYPQYRREGLPVTSAAVESLIKQFNQRVKGTEKFWMGGGAEAVLQVRAAYLSDDGRGEEFYQHRSRGHAVGRNRLRRVA